MIEQRSCWVILIINLLNFKNRNQRTFDHHTKLAHPMAVFKAVTYAMSPRSFYKRWQERQRRLFRSSPAFNLPLNCPEPTAQRPNEKRNLKLMIIANHFDRFTTAWCAHAGCLLASQSANSSPPLARIRQFRNELIFRHSQAILGFGIVKWK